MGGRAGRQTQLQEPKGWGAFGVLVSFSGGGGVAGCSWQSWPGELFGEGPDCPPHPFSQRCCRSDMDQLPTQGQGAWSPFGSGKAF